NPPGGSHPVQRRDLPESYGIHDASVSAQALSHRTGRPGATAQPRTTMKCVTSPLRPTGQGFGTAARDRPTVDRTLLRMAFLIPGGLSLLAGLNAALLLLGLPA